MVRNRFQKVPKNLKFNEFRCRLFRFSICGAIINDTT